MTPRRLLIAEDEIMIALDLSSTLEKLGYEVVGIAANAEQAIEEAGSSHPDLVLMDVHLRGETSGIVAAQTIHERFGIHSVLVTADASRADSESDAVVAVVTKPYLRADLERAVRDALARG